MILPLAALQSDTLKSHVANVVLDRLNPTLQGTLLLGRIEGNLIAGLVLRDVALLDDGGLEVAGFERLEINYSLPSLLRRRIVVNKVTLANPRFHLEDSHGNLAVLGALAPVTEPTERPPPDPGDPTAEPPPWHLEIREFALLNGTVAWSPDEDLLRLRDIEISLRIGARTGAEPFIEWHDLSVAASLSGLPPQAAAALGEHDRVSLTTSGRLSPEQLTLTTLEVGAGPHHLDLSGQVPLVSDSPDWDAPVALALESAMIELGTLTGGEPEAPLRGPAELRGMLRGTLGRPEALFEIETLGGTLTLEASATLDAPEPRATLALAWPNAAPGKIIKALSPELSGSLALSLSGEGNPLDGGQATLEIDLAELALQPLLAHTIALRANLEDRRATLDLELSGPREEALHLRATADDVRPPPHPLNVEVDVTGRAISLAQLSNFVEELTLEGYLTDLNATARARLAGEGSDPFGLQHATAKLSLTTEGLGVPGAARLARGDLSAEAEWDGSGLPQGQMQLSSRDLQAGEARVKSGAIQLTLTREEGLGRRLHGRIELEHAALGDPRRDGVSADRVRLPLDMLLPRNMPLTPPLDIAAIIPRGGLSLEVRGLKRGPMSARNAGASLNLGRRGKDITLAGPMVVEGLRLDREGSGVASVDLRLESTWQPARRLLGGRLEVGAQALRLAPASSLDRVTAELLFSTATTRGLPVPRGPLNLHGTLELRALESGDDLAITRAAGDFEGALEAGRSHGSVRMSATELRLPVGMIPEVKLNADLDPDGAARAHLVSHGETMRADAKLSFLVPTTRKATMAATIEHLVFWHGRSGLVVQPGGSARLTPAGVLSLSGLRIQGMGALSRSRLEADMNYDPQSDRVFGRVKLSGVELADWERALFELLSDPDGAEALGSDPTRPTLLAGALEGHINFAGSLASPGAQIELALSEGRVGEATDLTGRLDGSIGNEGILLGLDASWAVGGTGEGANEHRTAVTLNADLPLEFSLAPGSLRLHLPPDKPLLLLGEVDGFDLALLRPLLPSTVGGAPLSGRMNGHLQLEGSLQSPLGSISLLTDDFVLNRPALQSIDIAAALDEKLSRVRVRVREQEQPKLNLWFEIEENLVEVVASGAAELIEILYLAPFDLTLEVPKMGFMELPFVAAIDPRLESTTLEARLEAKGTKTEPTVKGRLDVNDLPLQDQVITAELTLDTLGEALEATFESHAEGRALFSAELHIPDLVKLIGGHAPRDMLRDPRLRARAQVPALTPESLTQLVGPIGEMADSIVRGGVISGRFELRGGAAGPEASLVVASENPHPHIAGRQPPFAQAMNLTATATPHAVKGELLLDQGDLGGRLRATSRMELGTALLLGDSMPVIGDLPLLLDVESHNFSLQGLAELQPEIFGPSTGQLEVDLEVRGTVATPEVRGRIEARFDELVIALAGLYHRDVTLTLDVTPERIVLQPFTLERGGGTLELGAGIDTPSYLPDEMRLEGALRARRFRAVNRDDMSARMTTDLEIGGSIARPRIAGQIRVDSARITPELSTRTLQPIGLPRDVQVVSAADFDEARLRALTTHRREPIRPELEIQVTIPNRHLHVSSDMLDLFLTGGLEVGTTGGALTLGGRVTVDEGSVELYGRRFSVEEDSGVVFTGTTELNPRINVHATYGIADVDLSPIGLQATGSSAISIRVSGTAESPSINLSSTPPMDETNILAILLTNAPVGAMAGEGAGAEQQALNMFVGLATGRFAGILQEGLPLDILRVEAGEHGFADARFRVGKRITRDLLLLYEANLGAKPDENANQVIIQYRLTRLLQLETHFGDAGKGGIDLLLRWRF